MKAVVYKKYGEPDVLQLVELAKPSPKKKEILVRVYATTVTRGDVRMRSFTVPAWDWLFARLYLGIFKPRRQVLGMSLAGEVEAVGSAVTKFKVGDRVFASTFAANFGGYAEYKCLSENGMVTKIPEGSSCGEAAAIPGGGTMALRFLRRAKLKSGQEVLIYGASGAIGSCALQLAKSMGVQVTAVCSGANFELVKSLGADKVIDYTKEDFTHMGKQFDLVLDAVGKTSLSQCRALLKKDGSYLNANSSSSGGSEKIEELRELVALFEQGKMKPYVDRVYPLEEIVEAHRYVDTGRKRGNVVISV